MRNVSVYKCENIVKWALDICDHEKLLKFRVFFYDHEIPILLYSFLKDISISYKEFNSLIILKLPCTIISLIY